jgi:hypothetical protein
MEIVMPEALIRMARRFSRARGGSSPRELSIPFPLDVANCRDNPDLPKWSAPERVFIEGRVMIW